MTAYIPVEKVLPNPSQPRRNFDAAELDGLAESIRQHGVILPVSVEEAENGFFILEDGERRLRAARMVGLKTIPANIRPARNGTAPRDRLIRAVVANVQRSDLNPIEEAQAYRAMRDDFGMSIDKIALAVGICRKRVDDRLKLLQLDEPIQSLIANGVLQRDVRLAEALMAVPDSAARIKLANRLVGSNIRSAVEACEKLAVAMREKQPASSDVRIMQDAKQHVIKRTCQRKLPPTQWDMLSQVGRLPPWPAVRDAANLTCGECAFRSTASPDLCRDCPAISFVKHLLDQAIDHEHRRSH